MTYSDIEHIGRLRAAKSKGLAAGHQPSPLASFSNNDLLQALKAMQEEPLTAENRGRLNELVDMFTKMSNDQLTNGLTDLGVKLSSAAEAYWKHENKPPAGSK